jgi:glycine cleavage system H protein
MTTRYTPEHEWIRLEGKDVAVVGISDYAQEQLGDVVFVELPAVGKTLAKGDEAAVVESVKAASEVYAPVAGTIVAVNDAISRDPGLVNTSAEGDGWFLKIKVTNPADLEKLMDEKAYGGFIKTTVRS